MYTQEQLESRHTKQLLNILNDLRRGCGDCDKRETQDGCLNCDSQMKLVKQVLSTREHIPNKADNKKHRQEMAKKKR